MIPAVARFVEALRREGVVISPAEVIDAARAVDAVGLERRDRFRAALSATLAKGARARDAFDRTFDRFFAAPARGPSRGERKDARGAGAGEPRSERGEGRGRRSAKEPPEKPTRGRREREREGETGRRAVDDARRESRRGTSRLRKVHVRSERPREHDPLHKDLSRSLPTEEERSLARELPRLVQELRLRSSRRHRRARGGIEGS